MNRKRKIGILFVLIGFGIPVVLFFFQYDGVIYEKQTTNVFERKLTPAEHLTIQTKLDAVNKTIDKIEDRLLQLDLIQDLGLLYELNTSGNAIWTIRTRKAMIIPYRQIVGVGITFIFFGFGILIFSFFPKDKPKKIEVEE